MRGSPGALLEAAADGSPEPNAFDIQFGISNQGVAREVDVWKEQSTLLYIKQPRRHSNRSLFAFIESTAGGAHADLMYWSAIYLNQDLTMSEP